MMYPTQHLRMAYLYAKCGDESRMLEDFWEYYRRKKMPISEKVKERLYEVLTDEGLPHEIVKNIQSGLGVMVTTRPITYNSSYLISARADIERLLALKSGIKFEYA